MFLDVNGTITTEKTDTGIENARKQIVEGLHIVHAEADVNQGGEISWRGSYLLYDVWRLVPILRIFWLMRGKIIIQGNSKGGLDLQYYISLLHYRILLIIVDILTDNGGNATTTITTQYTGDIFVTVTYSNCHPYEGICRVRTTVANPASFRDSEIQLETRLNYVVSGDGSILINYQVSEINSHLRMTIYDVTGRKVKTLIGGECAPGVHSLRWNKHDDNERHISSGAYFCELQAQKTKTRWVKKFFVP